MTDRELERLERRMRLAQLLAKARWPAVGDHARLMLSQLDAEEGRALARLQNTRLPVVVEAGRSRQRRADERVPAYLTGLSFLLILILLAMATEACNVQ